MNQSHSSESFNTLGNAAELATRVIARVAGDLVSSNLGGQPATSSVLSQAIAAKMQQSFKTETGETQ